MSFGALLLVCAGTYAQEQEQETKEQQLEEVVVSDSRFELKRENSGKTVIKITAKELEQNQGKTLAELINTKSGIEINGSRSNAGQNLGYFVRGGNNRQVLIMIDGIQVSDPSQIANDYDLRLVALDQIESVEILKGAASTLYGSGAATAVINIVTKKAKEGTVHLNIASSMGSNQSQDDEDYELADFSNSVAVNGTLDKFNYQAGFSNQYTDGLSALANTSERDPFSRINTNLKLGYNASKFSIALYGDYSRYTTGYDDSFGGLDANFESENKQLRTGLSASYTYNDGSFTVNAAYNDFEREFRDGFPRMNEAKTYVVDAFNKYNFDNSFYTVLGVNYIENDAVFTEEETITTADPYLNVVYVSDFGLNLNAGARFANHSEFGSELTYNLNPSYTFKLDDNSVKLLASYSTSFIAPSLFQLFDPLYGNTDLDPEENRTIEAGLAFSVGKKFNVSALYFNREEKNFIDFVTLGFDPVFTAEYQNVTNDFNVSGAEVELNYTPIESLSVSANYTFIEKKDVVSLRLPKHKANLNIGYDFSKKTFASLAYQYNGERLDTNFTTFTDDTLDGYGLLDLYVSHQLVDSKMKVFASVSNLLNEDYVELIGFTTRGRNVRLGFSLNL